MSDEAVAVERDPLAQVFVAVFSDPPLFACAV
jgi:hypothetical protein